MIEPGEIYRKANALKVSDKQIEKDYVISWILYGLSFNEKLTNSLAFKGGTVLKKAYFEDYRFSEDIDFTLLDDSVSNDDILSEFDKVFEFVNEESNIILQVSKEKLHEATGSLKFFIDYVASLDGKPGSRDIKVDVTRQEILEFDLQDKKILADYSDLEDEDFRIKCYSLSEVLIEKMTAVMGRTIPRDIYDLWYLFEIDGMDLDDHYIEFERKASNKGHNPSEFRKKLDGKINTYQRDWKTSLGGQINDLPDFKGVVRELNKHLRKHYK